MLVNEAMTRSLDRIEAGATLKEAGMAMDKNDDGALAVTRDGEVIGVVTDRDIVIRGVASGADPDEMLVEHVMSEEPITCRFDSDLTDAAKTMESKKVRRLIVKDSNDLPIGLISVGDIAANASDEELTGEVMRSICNAG
jgi:CBS domain-containing protein